MRAGERDTLDAMWRVYLMYVVDGLKVLALGVVAVIAWLLASWVLGGRFGVPAGSEPWGWSTDFSLLFAVFLFIGIALVTPLLWGRNRKTRGN